MKQLILGGARSGKSRLAEQRALATKKHSVYLATATAGDREMAERIAAHQKSRRDKSWRLVEEPVNIASAIKMHDQRDTAIVVDCLTLWLANCLGREACTDNGEQKMCFSNEKTALLEYLPSLKGDIFFVSNEVGSGVVPLGQLSREFVDHSGWLHQHLATLCDQVTLVVAGLPLELKSG